MKSSFEDNIEWNNVNPKSSRAMPFVPFLAMAMKVQISNEYGTVVCVCAYLSSCTPYYIGFGTFKVARFWLDFENI